MSVLPILFNADMVRALLDERKTVTRRVVRFREGWNPKWTGYVPEGPVLYGSNNIPAAKCQYRPGDILYVRETWCPYDKDHVIDGKKYAYGADATVFSEPVRKTFGYKWRPSIHMPKEAARIFLRVKSVRAERLQDSFTTPISPIFELRAEGMDIGHDCRNCISVYGNPCCIDNTDDVEDECGLLDEVRGEFSDLWDSTVKAKDLGKYGWAANPLVWVIKFERTERPENWPEVRT